MKRFFSLIIIAFSVFSLSAKELEGIDLQAVQKVLNAKLYVNDYEDVDKKLEYLKGVQSEIKKLESEISDEAKLICKNILILETETAKLGFSIEAMEAEMEKSKAEKAEDKKNRKKKTKDDEEAKIPMDCYNSYVEFAQTHEDVSSHFLYHQKEAEFATLPYLTTSQQLKILSTVMDDYKKIEEINPLMSENLSYLGIMMYFIPGAFGGSKKIGEEKIRKAIDSASCTYEAVNANIMLSQILFEEKRPEEAKIYLEKAVSLDKYNTTVKQVKEMNEAGFSFFQMEKYLKKRIKDKKSEN